MTESILPHPNGALLDSDHVTAETFAAWHDARSSQLEEDKLRSDYWSEFKRVKITLLNTTWRQKRCHQTELPDIDRTFLKTQCATSAEKLQFSQMFTSVSLSQLYFRVSPLLLHLTVWSVYSEALFWSAPSPESAHLQRVPRHFYSHSE